MAHIDDYIDDTHIDPRNYIDAHLYTTTDRYSTTYILGQAYFGTGLIKKYSYIHEQKQHPLTSNDINITNNNVTITANDRFKIRNVRTVKSTARESNDNTSNNRNWRNNQSVHQHLTKELGTVTEATIKTMLIMSGILVLPWPEIIGIVPFQISPERITRLDCHADGLIFYNPNQSIEEWLTQPYRIPTTTTTINDIEQDTYNDSEYITIPLEIKTAMYGIKRIPSPNYLDQLWLEMWVSNTPYGLLLRCNERKSYFQLVRRNDDRIKILLQLFYEYIYDSQQWVQTVRNTPLLNSKLNMTNHYMSQYIVTEHVLSTNIFNI